MPNCGLKTFSNSFRSSARAGIPATIWPFFRLLQSPFPFFLPVRLRGEVSDRAAERQRSES